MKLRLLGKIQTLFPIFLMFALVFSSCSKEEAKEGSAQLDVAKEEVIAPSETQDNADIDPVFWQLSDEEKNDNWKAFKEIGFKVHMPKEISAKKDVINVDMLGDEEVEDYPIHSGYLYTYYAEATKNAYKAIINDETTSHEDKVNKIQSEITPQIKEIFALLTLRKAFITEENTIEKILEQDEMKFAKVEEVGQDGQYIYAVAFSNGEDVAGLGDADAKQYKELVEVAKAITKEAKTSKPVSKKASLQAVKGLSFDTQDLEGKQVTSNILQKAKVTMVNIWATWCPPCKAELPDIGRLAKKYKAKGGQIIAICSDVTDEDISALEDAKDIIADAECDEVIVLRKNKTLDSIFANIRAFPTTIFFDSQGNVIAPIIVGGRSEQEFARTFDECLAKVK